MANGGSAVIKDCNFSSNIGAEGGAISGYPGSHLSVETSLFYNNTAHREASASGGGGAIAFTGASANLTNCTFFGNYTTFNGGAIGNGGPMTVTNCTFESNASKNGGAIDNSNYLLLRNSIIANSEIGNNCVGIFPLTDGGGNLRWPATDDSCVGSFGDPRLAPLADNGGPTLTMALQLGSAAVRLATANCPTADQRGAPRGLSPGSCDAGAYEWQGLFVFFPAVYRNPTP